MDIALLSQDGVQFLFRWFHFFFGIIWIGLLYYFNFVQGAFFAETDANTKSAAIQKLVPRALWWFRWGAMFTLLTGWAYLLMEAGKLGGAFMASSYGPAIMTGALFGTFMWANVWFVIWPNQKIVIQSATQAASGGKALPEAAAAGARGLVASRTNTMFSIPLLFYMGAARHLPITMGPDANVGAFFAFLAVVLVVLEINALKGKTGPMTSVKGVIHCGFGLSLVVYAAMEILL